MKELHPLAVRFLIMVAIPSLLYGTARTVMACSRGVAVDGSYAIAFVVGAGLLFLIPSYALHALQWIRQRSGLGPALKASVACLGLGALGGLLMALDPSHPGWVFGFASLLLVLVGLTQALTFGFSKDAPSPQPAAICWPILSVCPLGLGFFDPKSMNDIRLTTYNVDASHVLFETDSINMLEEFLKRSKGGQMDFLVYINLGDPGPDGSRAYKWFDKKRASQLGSLLKTSPFTKLMLVATSFEPGSLRLLADEIGRSLELLSLLYYFSGDDLTDYPQICDELGGVALVMQLERLSVLTGEFNGSLEKRLAQALKPVTSLKVVDILKKDDTKTWPRIPTPELDAEFMRRRSAAET